MKQSSLLAGWGSCLIFYPPQAVRCDHISHHLMPEPAPCIFLLQLFINWHMLKVWAAARAEAGTFLLQKFHIFPLSRRSIVSFFFYSFVFCEDHVCAAGPRHFPSTFCNMHNSIYLYIISRLDFIFPQRHTNKLKFSLKTITEEKRKQRRPCSSGSITRFTNHRKKVFSSTSDDV